MLIHKFLLKVVCFFPEKEKIGALFKVASLHILTQTAHSQKLFDHKNCFQKLVIIY